MGRLGRLAAGGKILMLTAVMRPGNYRRLAFGFSMGPGIHIYGPAYDQVLYPVCFRHTATIFFKFPNYGITGHFGLSGEQDSKKQTAAGEEGEYYQNS